MKNKAMMISAALALVATVAFAPVIVSAASKYIISRSTQVKPGAISYGDISASARARLHGTVGTALGTPGPAGATGATGAAGAPGSTGATGAAGTNGTNGTNATTESWSDCTATLCLDAPPEGVNGLDGSSGWGWDNTLNAPVTSLSVGSSNSFTVTVLQSAPAGVSGTITLAWSSSDFTLSDTSGNGTVGTNPFDRGGVETFAYDSDFFTHNDQSDSFTFTAVGADPSALVTATVNVGGQQASETFPVSIVAAG